MIKKLISLGFGFLPLFLHAQVTINAQLPQAGLVQKDQLWNLILVNNKGDVSDLNIKMNLKDAISGQVVLSANTGSLMLGKGVKIITWRDIQPITYNYSAPELSRNYLPMGTYIACYQVYHAGEKGDEPLGDECIRIHIDPLSPPLLNSPADKSEIQTPYPQFTWMPPTPFDMFSNLNYEILVAEVLPGQSSMEAIQYNTPLYTKSNIIQTNENYPSSFSSLDTGKLYAWQIIANNGLSYAAKTEIWTFRLKRETKIPEPPNDNYILLDNAMEGTYIVRADTLHVKYFSFAASYETMVSFSDENGRLVKEVKQKVKQGDNYFDFKIGNDFQQQRVYKVTITDASKKQHSLRFSINKN